MINLRKVMEKVKAAHAADEVSHLGRGGLGGDGGVPPPIYKIEPIRVVEAGKDPQDPQDPHQTATIHPVTGLPEPTPAPEPASPDDACTWQEWTPTVGCIGTEIGFDTETEKIVDEATVPRLVLASAWSAPTGGWLIATQHVGAFLEAHHDSTLILHHAAFDREVILQVTGFDLCDWLDADHLRDTGILYRLVRLGETSQVSQKWALDVVASEMLDASLEKDEDIRLGFGQFLKSDGTVDISALPREFASYAVKDAKIMIPLVGVLTNRATELAAQNGTDPKLLLSHDIQVKAEFALATVSRNGMHVDPAAVKSLAILLDDEILALRNELLQKHCYAPGPGEHKRYADAIARVEADLGIKLPRTAKSGAPTRAEEHLQDVDHPFIKAFLALGTRQKHRSTFIEPLLDTTVIHPSFNTLVNTGRTSCRAMNLQQLPRDERFRNLFVPAPGHVLLAADYSGIELCALAQITYWRYGYSTMRDLLNAGEDLHAAFAAKLLEKDPAAVTKEERGLGKIGNFGLSGGLGAEKLQEYAKANYGRTLTLQEATDLRNAWFKTFPEMVAYMRDRGPTLANDLFGNLDDVPVDWPVEMVLPTALRIASGNCYSRTTGNPYPPALIEWVWCRISEAVFPGSERFEEAIASRCGNLELKAALDAETVVWPSGRVRPGCAYTVARNGPFQGLVSDGAKLALYRLVRAGFHVSDFIHDEFLVELPEDADHLALARQVERIMIEEMQRVIPDVRIAVEFALMRRWYKGAKVVYDNKDCPTLLLPWEPVKPTAPPSPARKTAR